VDFNGKLLRLQCPFCGAEFTLWFRPDVDDATLTPAEWEKWLDTPCKECGRQPREHRDETLGTP
jgi:hypothetical protein